MVISVRVQLSGIELKEVDAREARGEDAVAPVALVPSRDENAVLHPFIRFADHLALPFTGPVNNQRRMVARIIGRRGLQAGERRVDGNLVPRAVDIGPADAVRARNRVYLRELPGLARISLMLQHAHLANTL